MMISIVATFHQYILKHLSATSDLTYIFVEVKECSGHSRHVCVQPRSPLSNKLPADHFTESLAFVTSRVE